MYAQGVMQVGDDQNVKERTQNQGSCRQRGQAKPGADTTRRWQRRAQKSADKFPPS